MRQFHIFLTIILCLMTNICFACDDKKPLQANVINWMTWLNRIGQPANALSKADLKKYYAKDVKVYVNAKLVAKNIDELYSQYVAIRKENHSLHVQSPPEEMIIDGNKVALRCVFTLVNQKTQTINDVAILEFDKDKKIIQLWEMLDVPDPVKIRN